MTISVENRARLAFVMVLLVGAAAALAWYLHTSRQYTTYQIVTHDSVSGLIPDAPVELHGVDVGKVHSVELIDPHTVSILLYIRRKVPITTTTLATITSRGLATKGFTGYVYIAMEENGGGTPLVTAADDTFPRISTAPSRSLSLDTAISQVNQNVQELTELLQSVLDKKTIASLKESVESLEKVTRMLAENNKRLNAIIQNTEQASNQFKPLLESSNNAVRTLQVQILPESYRTLDKLNRLSDSINGVTNKIERDPSVLLRGTAPPAPGPGEVK
jgi:phospholipid/cholesterol/gamma-HCH transport system substrate-binding protein